MFVDRALITIKAGDGGNGITSFIHYKGKVGGGPDGGDGAKGGDVIFVADKSKTSLADYYYKTKFVAENGENGGPKECFGKSGKDVVLGVPLGTVIKDRETGNIIADMFYEGQSVTVLVGGDGGKGNARFKNARRHAPHFSQTGEKTESKQVILELKTIADVGLVGFPNVGKSTILSKITRARPKIANYHFATLSPSLGICDYYDNPFVIADIPGLIEGASEGAGLGTEFLRHIERTRMLVHVVDISGVEGRDPYEDYLKINAELKNYSKELSKLKQIVVANKTDAFDSEERLKEFKQKIGRKHKVIPVSAITGQGLDTLKAEIYKVIEKLPPVKPLEFEEFKYEKPDKLYYEILKEGETFVIVGTLVEVLKRNVVMTDMHSLAYMHKVLRDRGIIKELRQMGATEKSTIIIGGEEFELLD
jgi:GTP-binding protein